MQRNKYLEALSIDKYDLDEECVRQPQLYMEWALKLVTASDEEDDAKKDLDLVRADIERKIRRNPKRYKIKADKPTEGAIRAEIALHPKVKKYERLYAKAVHNKRVLTKMEKSFSHRKSSLESLVILDMRLHFSEPKLPKEVRDRQNRDNRTISRTIKRKLKRKLKRR